jgi:hypothetical protein
MRWVGVLVAVLAAPAAAQGSSDVTGPAFPDPEPPDAPEPVEPPSPEPEAPREDPIDPPPAPETV